MKPLAVVGAFIITLSWLAYGIASISLIRFKIVDTIVLFFFTLGVIFDATAITFMIISARSTPFSVHGILGYSALLVMLIDTFFVWRIYFKHGIDAHIGRKFLWYVKFAYFWWVLAYLTGSLIILWR